MKKLIFVAFLIIPLFCFSQKFKPDFDTNGGVFLDTVADSKLTKQQLYSNTISFISKSFSDSKAVIETKDVELGEVAFYGYVPFVYTDTTKLEKKKKTIETISTWEVKLYFKSRVYLKDQKYKVVLSSLEVSLPTYPGLTEVRLLLKESSTTESHIEGKKIALELIQSISAFLNRPPENEF